jgi:hypothetical protein
LHRNNLLVKNQAKMKNYFLSLMVFVLTILVACGGGETKETTDNSETTTETVDENATAEYDLNANGIPVVVTCPAGAEVKKGMGNAEIDGVKTINYEVAKDDFRLDVTYTTGAEYAKNELLADAKQFAKEEDGFVEFVSEEDLGFIYKLKTEDGDDYSFYYLLLKNAEPIEFGKGFSLSVFSLEQIKELYEVAKAAK